MSKPKPKPPVTPLAGFLSLLWRIPLYAVPFALFFLLVLGGTWSRLPIFMVVSLIFTSFTSITVWFTSHWIAPRVKAWRPNDPRAVFYVSLAYIVMSLMAVAAAALTLHFTLIPGFLGNARGVVLMIVYTLMFGVMFLGVSLAMTLHKEALERAGSERELQLARRIQRSFLLSEFPQRPRIEVHAENLSSKEVSGDFYDVVVADNETILLVIADVSGKGVPAALLSSMLQASVRTQAGVVKSPADILKRVNALACQRASTGQFATFFLAAYHEPTSTLTFTNAGHNFPVLQRASGERVLLETGGIVVGMMEGLDWQEESIQLLPGDRVVLYTDGVSEAANAAGDMLGEERLYEMLDAAPRTLGSQQLVRHVLDGVRAFLGDMEAGDDITVMALRVLDPPPAGPRA